ncbi:hypothetical protein H4219_003097 [Mycoemilia scoparia]|uniref:Lysophospholipase n=1 Tax=Mycoemilia scoparia TaxID=417184 RepID=A0A9W7ZWK2_9FUNG|nr:hypothetical protein H4219_003097 [Mycoemilia scoparia]
MPPNMCPRFLLGRGRIFATSSVLFSIYSYSISKRLYSQQKEPESKGASKEAINTEVIKEKMSSSNSQSVSLTGLWENMWESILERVITSDWVQVSMKEHQSRELHPKITEVANVRVGSELCKDEQEFIIARKKEIKPHFAKFIGVPESEIDVRDIPTISIAATGGGFRAMLSTLGYISSAKDHGLYQCVSYVAGVSGSCWALGGLNTYADGDPERVISNLMNVMSTDVYSFTTIIDVIKCNATAARSVLSDIVFRIVMDKITLAIRNKANYADAEKAASNDPKDIGVWERIDRYYASITPLSMENLNDQDQGVTGSTVDNAQKDKVASENGDNEAASNDPKNAGVLEKFNQYYTSITAWAKESLDDSDQDVPEFTADIGEKWKKVMMDLPMLPDSIVSVYGAMLYSRLIMQQHGPQDHGSLDSNSTSKNQYWLDPKWAKLSNQSNTIKGGRNPMPIYTAVRHEIVKLKGDQGEASKDKKVVELISEEENVKTDPQVVPKTWWQSLSCWSPFSKSINQQQQDQICSTEGADGNSKRPRHYYQWFELTPYEVGSIDDNVWIPTWALGRPLKNGKSWLPIGETHFGSIMGTVGSAFCASVRSMIEEIFPSLPGFTKNFLRDMLTKYDQDVSIMHPIPPYTIFSPFYQWSQSEEDQEARSSSPSLKNKVLNNILGNSSDNQTKNKSIKEGSKDNDIPESTLESDPLLSLMDAGITNNIPFAPLLREDRNVDVIICLDSSADIDDTAWFERAELWAQQHNIKRWPWGIRPWSKKNHIPRSDPKNPYAPLGADDGGFCESVERISSQAWKCEIELESNKTRCIVFSEPVSESPLTCKFGDDDHHGDANKEGSSHQNHDHDDSPIIPIQVLYFPMLKNVNFRDPDFDPQTASFCNTFNSAWTPQQISLLTGLSYFNMQQEIDKVKSALKKAWETKRDARINKDLSNTINKVLELDP